MACYLTCIMPTCLDGHLRARLVHLRGDVGLTEDVDGALVKDEVAEWSDREKKSVPARKRRLRPG